MPINSSTYNTNAGTLMEVTIKDHKLITGPLSVSRTDSKIVSEAIFEAYELGRKDALRSVRDTLATIE